MHGISLNPLTLFSDSFFFCISGEALEPEQVDAVFKDCMGEEDEDGNIKYARKYFTLNSFQCATIIFSMFSRIFDLSNLCFVLSS